MIFQHTWQAVLEGRKSQTRRLVKSGEWLSETVIPEDCYTHKTVVSISGRVKWTVCNDFGQYPNGIYAVQPGRGKKQVGRIRITGIRQERVQDITGPDAYAEGCTSISDFVSLWNDVHSTKDTQWRGNPLVWVLEFELMTT